MGFSYKEENLNIGFQTTLVDTAGCGGKLSHLSLRKHVNIKEEDSGQTPRENISTTK